MRGSYLIAHLNPGGDFLKNIYFFIYQAACIYIYKLFMCVRIIIFF